MISHALIAFGAPARFVVLACLAWITVRSENRHKPHHGGQAPFMKASRVTF
jgi:hypothetical protein